MSDTPNSATDQADTTVDELRSLIREAEQALGSAGDGASDEIQALRERLRDVVADGQTTIRNLADNLRRQAARADELVRANPYKVIGIATGVGLLLGLLLSRRGAADR